MTAFNNKDAKLKTEETLGSRIAQRRKALSMTQEEFSQLLGVTAQAVSKWENDISCPDIMLLPKISEVLDISIDELMGIEKKFTKQEEKVSDAGSLKERSSVPDVSKLKLRINIIDSRNKPINIALPMPFVMRMANMGIKISSVLGTSAINDSQLEQILELVKNGVAGEIFDFTSDDGTKIKIEIS